ncbi:hypothetical protein DU19_0801 [Chlamydia muridarum]|nr:hypothetical protein DU17_0803 [Chlamydia muridarum]KDU81749.1 hypothetical protein DU18_0801 [Chlamydia muridarum]KDU82004.1 hypothetical protein DU19_0801 [Chlamydia muridarum]KDU83704.1 hypothetical protein DU20_0801 [Chlamydia muridarum]KDU84087.1 hypothetical protein DU21_0803 [Chlamydia muridarum]
MINKFFVGRILLSLFKWFKIFLDGARRYPGKRKTKHSGKGLSALEM